MVLVDITTCSFSLPLNYACFYSCEMCWAQEVNLKSGDLVKIVKISALSKSILNLLNGILFYKFRSAFTFFTADILTISSLRFSSNFWKTCSYTPCIYFSNIYSVFSPFVISVNKILYKELKIHVQGLETLCVMLTLLENLVALNLFFLIVFPNSAIFKLYRFWIANHYMILSNL